jgi:hypothetical protein
MSRPRIAAIVVLSTSLSLLAPAGSASAGVTADPVVTGKPDQFGPGAEDDEWVGWSQFVTPLVTAHIKTLTFPVDHRRLRRRDDSHTFFGGFDPTNDDVIFQEVRRASSNLFLYHVLTDKYDPAPDGINTERWEWNPDISTAFILFGRNRFNRASSPWKVMLYDRVGGTFETLDSVPNRCGCIRPEAVSDHFAAWTSCEGVRCQVFVHDTDDDTTVKVPNPNEKQQYAAAVSDDGEVYFVRSGNGCGANVQIRRWEVGSGPSSTLVFDLPAGTDLRNGLDLVEGADTNDDLYFDQLDCDDRRFRGDIYRILDVNTIAAPDILAPQGGASGAGAWRGPDMNGARPES